MTSIPQGLAKEASGAGKLGGRLSRLARIWAALLLALMVINLGLAVRYMAVTGDTSAFLTHQLLLPVSIVTYAVLAIVQGPFLVAIMMAGPESSTAFVLNLIGTVAGSVGSALTAPLMIVAFAVLYYDLRVRQEGLDLQIMIGNLGAVPPPASTAPAAPPSPMLPS